MGSYHMSLSIPTTGKSLLTYRQFAIRFEPFSFTPPVAFGFHSFCQDAINAGSGYCCFALINFRIVKLQEEIYKQTSTCFAMAWGR